MHMDILVNTILSDFRHALKNSWFSIAVLAAVVSFWLDLGTDAFWLLRGGGIDPMDLLRKALSGAGSALSLPLLASLPCAAGAWQELTAGAARMAVFRCGRPAYIAGKLLAAFCMAALAQAAGAFLFTGLLLAISPAPSAAFPVSVLGARLLSAMFFSVVGGIGALLARDTVSAYAIPTAIGFSLSLLSARFFIGVPYVSPLAWLAGDRQAIRLLLLLLAVASTAYIIILRREMDHYV